MQTVQNAVTQVTRLTRLTGYCWQMVLLILAHLKVHYNVLGTWVHLLLHLFVTGYFHFHLCFHFNPKSERSHLFKNTQFNLSFWMKWLFCKYSALFNSWPLTSCHISFLNSWTLPSYDQMKEEFKSSNSIFELLNFWPIWIYNFWTLELFLYLNI